MDMYTNNIIVSFCGLVGYFFAGAVIRAIGAKRLLSKQKPFLFVVSSLYYLLVLPTYLFDLLPTAYGLFISAVLGFGLYWSINGLTTIIISSAFITVAGVAVSSLLGAVVALFPTQLR